MQNDKVYQEFKAKLERFLKRKFYLMTREDLEDTVSNVFEKWQKFVNLSGCGDFTEAKIRNTLFKYGKNHVLNERRKKGRVLLVNDMKSDNEEDERDESDLFTMLDKSRISDREKEYRIECCKKLVEIILTKVKLTDLETIIFNRRYIEGWLLVDIAEDLGIKGKKIEYVHANMLIKIKLYLLKINITNLGDLDFEVY